MPRYVILIHDFPFVHWDLLVEQGETLRSWRLLESPARWILATTPPALPAESIPDHRLAYLDFEGPVSGERGRVARWDAGKFERIEQTDDHVRLRLHGEQLCGELTIDRTENSPLWTAGFRSGIVAEISESLPT
jgi:DNA polymerase ligase (LigD)-like protein